MPRFLERLEHTARALAEAASQGVRLDDASIERLADAQADRNRSTRRALWTGALMLVAIVAWLLAPWR